MVTATRPRKGPLFWLSEFDRVNSDNSVITQYNLGTH